MITITTALALIYNMYALQFPQRLNEQFKSFLILRQIFWKFHICLLLFILRVHKHQHHKPNSNYTICISPQLHLNGIVVFESISDPLPSLYNQLLLPLGMELVIWPNSILVFFLPFHYLEHWIIKIIDYCNFFLIS